MGGCIKKMRVIVIDVKPLARTGRVQSRLLGGSHKIFFHDMDTEDHCFGSLEKGSSIDLQVNRGRKRLVRRFGVSGMGPRCFLTSEPPSHRRFNDRAGIRNPDRRFVET